MPSPRASARKPGAPQKTGPAPRRQKSAGSPETTPLFTRARFADDSRKKPRPPDDRLPADTKTPSQKPAPSKMETLENKTEKTQSKTSKGTTLS